MTTENGNETKGPTLLDRLCEQFRRSGGKPPGKQEQKRLLEQWKAARKTREQADAALVRAKEAESAAAASIISQCSGKSRITVDGVTWVPMSRGETAFFRREGSAGTIELG